MFACSSNQKIDFSLAVYCSGECINRWLCLQKQALSKYCQLIRCLKKYLAEFECVLFTSELKISADEDEHAASGAGWLAVDGVLALLEEEAGEVGHNVLRALDLLAFEGQHGALPVQVRQRGSVRIESREVVFHERLRHIV